LPKLRDQEKTKERAKKRWTYDIVVTGKSLRAVKKYQEKKTKDVTGNNKSMLGKMRNRQERKAMAKTLKIPFSPKYNAPFTKMGYKLIETKKDSKYTKLVLEVK
jgi:hypothetical protein